MRPPPNTSDGHIGIQIGVPATPPAAVSAPRLLFQFKGCTPFTNVSNLRHCIISTGIYSDTIDDLDARIPQPIYPFNHDTAGAIIGGDYDDDWAPFGFALNAWSLRLDYYSIENPDCRGMIELGCNFSSLQISIQVFDSSAIELASSCPADFPVKFHQYDIQLQRNPKQTQRHCLFWRQNYTRCTTSVSRIAVGPAGQRQTIWHREFSGQDFIYSLF